MLRLNHQESQMSVKDDTGSIDQNRNIMDNDDTSSDLSDSEHFLTKGAFLLTPATELQMERVGMICEKMSYKGPFSLTKTATGILFKFADLEDYQLTFKKGFHKVTGSRFYKKVPVPCRPQKTFTIFVFEIPEEIPEDDIRHSLYKFRSIVEVCRLPPSGGQTASVTSGGTKNAEKGACSTEISCVTSSGCVSTTSSSPPIVRVTLASLDECNVLLRDGLDFYGATYFPTEPALSTSIARAGGKKTVMHNSRLLDLVATSGLRIRDFLPVFDSTGFSRIPTPITKTLLQGSKDPKILLRRLDHKADKKQQQLRQRIPEEMAHVDAPAPGHQLNAAEQVQAISLNPRPKIPAKIPYLTPTRMTTLGRADCDYHTLDVVMSIAGQTMLPELVFLQLQQLVDTDLELTQEQFTRMRRTLMLKRAQDVYEKEKYRRAAHFVRLGPQMLIPAPLGHLVYSIGQYHNVAEGVVYDVNPPAQAAQAENWWSVDNDIVNGWTRTMRRMQKKYVMREMPLASDYQSKPLMLCTPLDQSNIRTVKAKYSTIELTDGLITFANVPLFAPPAHAAEDCHKA